MTAVYVSVSQFCDPDRTLSPSLEAFSEAIHENISTFAKIFAAVYIALYARFASQWNYLSNVYNQIKAAEARLIQGDAQQAKAIANWKAGYVEDAEALHLATKPTVALTILYWLKKGSDVEAAYDEHTGFGEPTRRLRLLRRLRVVEQRERSKHTVGQATPMAKVEFAPELAELVESAPSS
jgi:hypothetical protein